MTTPDTASAPYSAEAPPVTTSTRSTRLLGMLFRSTVPCELLGTNRRPSTSTSVRLAPRPRRSAMRPAILVGVPSAVVCGVSVGRNVGILFSASATSVTARSSSLSAPTAMTGFGEPYPPVVIRVPVIMISSTWSDPVTSTATAPGAGASAAMLLAAPAAAISPMTSADVHPATGVWRFSRPGAPRCVNVISCDFLAIGPPKECVFLRATPGNRCPR